MIILILIQILILNLELNRQYKIMLYEILFSLLLLIVGIFLIFTNFQIKWQKGFENNEFSNWLWGGLLIAGGIYTIIKAIIKMFN